MKAIITFVFGLLLNLGASAANEGNTFSGNKLTLQAKTAKGQDFRVRLEIAPWSAAYASPNLWGASTRKPRMVLSAFKATVAGEDLYIPFSAYADLAEPDSASIQRRGSDLVVMITGGVGADAYRSEVKFKNGQVVVSKSTRSVAMPKDVWEEIRYGLMVDN